MSKVQEIKKRLHEAQQGVTSSANTTSAQSGAGGSRVLAVKRKMVADVDGQYIQSFLSDSRDHISNTQREYEGLNWQNARSEEARVSRANASTHINQRARKVRTYLDAYKEDIPEEQYTALKQYLDDFDAFQNQSAASFRNAYAQFSQFETEDDYRAFTTFQKQLGEDIPAIDQQIADLEAEYETFDWTDASQREKMREYESKISQMKVYRRQAAAVQANKAAQDDLEKRIATYSKNADWDKLSKGIDVSADPDRKSDYSIVFELSRTNVAYDKETALANGTPEAEWNDIDQKRRYIGQKYGVDLYADIYDNVNIFNEIMSMLDDYSFEGGELSQQLWGERIGNSFKNMRHLTEDEQAVLNYIFHTQGRDAALQWHNSRMNIYQDRANGVLTEEMLNWGKEAPVRSSLASVAMTIGSGFEQIGDWISGDYNNSLARASSAIRSGVSEKTDLMIGNWDAFDFLYSTGMSGVDSWAASAFGKAGSVVLGLSAAAQATNDAMDRGMPKKQAFWHGLMSGVFECLFERLSIGNFKALKEVESEHFKDAVKNLAKTMFVNATEEACTEVANIAYDIVVNGDFSQYEAMLLQNMTDGMSEHEAKRNAALQLGGQVTEAAASGALMGLGFGVTGLSQGALKKASRKVRFNKALKNFENTQLKEFAPLIIAEALDLNPDNAQAMQLKAQLDSGKELSTGDLKALQTLAKESTIAVDSETAANRLKELGETGDVAAISKAAAKQAVGEKLTAAEKKILSQSQHAQQVVEELTKQQEAEFDAAETQPITAQQTNSADTDSMSTPAENVPETPYEVSVDNQTIQKSTGEAVALQKISSIKNGKMTFRTDAGTEVDAADVSYASEDEAIVYETVAQLCSNASAANLLVDAFHTGQVPGDIYARGIQEAYSYGKLNISQDDMMKHGSYVKDLTEHQRNVAYKMGQLFAGEQISREVAAIRKHKKSGQKVAGKVHFDGDRSKLNATQRAGLDAMELLAKGLGIQFYVFESDHNADGDRVGKSGWYDPKDGSIHIDLYAGNDGKGTILFTVAHELTHYIRQWSPAKFKILANYLIKQYGEKGVSVNELIDDQITKAALDNRTIDRDEAFEEMVADSMESMLTSGNVLQMMADVKAQDRTLWEKIRDWFKDFAEKLKKIINAYSDVEPDSVEGRLVADMQDVTVILEALYGDALLDAAENFDAETQKNTAVGGVKYSFAGRGANSADLTALERAQKLAEDGTNGESIRQQTGWFQGMDGSWRFEIDDSAMQISDEISNYMSLGDLLQHPRLYKAYPDMKYIDVVFQSLENGVYGSYNPQFDSINLDYSLKNVPEAIKDALIHELQHAIQNREGFTRGATVESWERKRKQGFDSRRKEDIRKAEETERELSRIQDEEPDFYRDMLELDAMAPNLPRGEVDWNTLEQIEDDPVEWQLYDARREELQKKYGEMKVWDFNDLLYQREQAAKNMGRTGVELYFDTAGEIEARDVANRLRMSSEQRKNSSPRLGNEDTVFAEDKGNSAIYIGDTRDGRRCYQSGYGTDVSMDQRVELFKGRIAAIFNLGAVELKTDVKKIRVRGDKFTSQKNIYGDHLSKTGEQEAKINSLYDLADILATAKYDPAATAKEPSYANPTLKPKNKAHKDVKYWYKFKNEIVFDEVPYTVTFNIRDKGGEQYQYLIDFKENKTPGLSNTAVKNLLRADQMSYSGIVAPTAGPVNKKLSSRDPAQQKIQKALEQENAQLKEDVSRLAELLKLQRTVTGGTKFTKTSVEAAARMLKKHANVKRMANTSELAQLLHTFYEAIASDTKPSWDKIKEQARPVVQWLQDHVDLQAERSEYAQTILDQIKGSQIYLDESQRAEAEYRFGSYNDFRKAMLGRIILVNEGSTSLDSWWHAMADQFPDVFNPDTTSTDMPGELYDIIDQLKNADTSRVEYEYNRASIAMDLTRQVYDSYWRVSTLHTVADRAQDKINELRYKHYRQMTELRTEKDATIAQIKADNRAALAAHRAKAEKKQREIVEQYQESRARAVDSRKRTEMRHQLHRVVKDIYKLYNRGKDTNNVKEEMKDFVFHALSSAELLLDDLYTDDDMIRNGVGIKLSTEANALLNRAKKILYRLDNPPAVSSVAQLDEWNHQEKKLKLDLSKIKTQLREAFLQERRNQKGDVLSMVMQDLCDAYEELANSKQPHIRNAFRPFVLMHLEGVRKNLKETRVEDMTLDQLTELHEAYTMVLTSIRDANKAFCANRSIDYMAKQLISEFGEQKRSKSKVKNFVRNVSDYAGWNYEKLYYALERIGSATFTQLFTNLANAENIIMEDIADAKAYQKKTVDKYGYNSWAINKKVDREFVDNLGHSFQLTLGEIMLLYAYTCRGNVWKQLATGGFVLEKKSLTDDRNVTAYKLTPAQCLSITNTLTDDQKHFVEDMQKYLSDVMGAKGNEVSMQLYGVKLYNDPNYCPVHIAGQYQARAEEATARKQAGFEKLSNAGFTKTKDIEAKATIAMESFMDIWVDHVNEMSRYHGAVPALEDIRRVMNYSDYSDGEVESKSVRAMMENRYGKQAVNYFDNLWREVNSGAVLDKLQSLPKKALSISRKMAVAYSLSVLVQQPSSISRAFAMVDPQYFAGLSGAGASAWGVAKTVTNRWSKKQSVAYAEMVKYAPGVTLAKEIGGFDASGGGIRNYLMDTEKNLITSMKNGTTGEKVKAVGDFIDDNPIANLPNLADKIAWIEIWNACKREVKDKHRSMDANGDAFMKLVGRRFTEVIRATQVYDSVFAKSPLLKSKNVAVQYIVSYMNEPNVVANMVESSIRDIRNGGFENFKKGAKKLIAVTRSIIFCNVLKSLIYAMRDDDEDETYIEKYMQALVGNLISDINIFNYIPFLRDLWSICKGYDVERPDISIFSDLIFSIEKYYKVKNKDISGMSQKELEEWDRQCTEADWGLIGAIAGCFGIPVKNIYREIDSLFNFVRICGENSGKTTWKTYGNACYQGVVDALPWVRQVSKSDTLYDALAAGDTATVNRLKSTFRDKDGNFNQSAYHSAVRKGLRKNDIRIQKAARARIAGDHTTANKLMSQIAEEGFFDYSDISAAVKAEYNDLKTN